MKHKSHCLVCVLLSADAFPPFLYSTSLFQLCISVDFSVTTDGLGEATLRTMYFDDGAEAGLLSYVRCNNYQEAVDGKRATVSDFLHCDFLFRTTHGSYWVLPCAGQNVKIYQQTTNTIHVTN